MKPAPFDYLCPKEIGEALDLLQRHKEEARILAGGQSLVPILNFRLSRFGYLIDINRIPELSYIAVDNGILKIGAMTRYRAIENSAMVGAHAPLLAIATKSIAHLPVRSRGTIGGSLAHADPAAEYPAVLLALNGTIVVRNSARMREIKAADFLQGLFTTALEPDELLTEIRIPIARKDQAFGFEEFARRPGDLAIVGIAASLEFKGKSVGAARLAAFGVAGGAQRIAQAEDLLRDRPCSPEQIERAARAASGIATQSDVHATAKLRSHLAGVMTRRALTKALRSYESRVK